LSAAATRESIPTAKLRGIAGAPGLRFAAAGVEQCVFANAHRDVSCEGRQRIASRQSVAPLAPPLRGDKNSCAAAIDLAQGASGG